MVDLSVNLAGMIMDNPVVPASGTFGFGKEFKDFYDINMLGSFSFKGTTKEERFGNPTPRIAECTSGMINAVGLQNPGVHHVVEHELVEMKEYFHKRVIANVQRLFEGQDIPQEWIGNEKQVLTRLYLVCDSKEELRDPINEYQNKVKVLDGLGNNMLLKGFNANKALGLK